MRQAIWSIGASKRWSSDPPACRSPSAPAHPSPTLAPVFRLVFPSRQSPSRTSLTSCSLTTPYDTTQYHPRPKQHGCGSREDTVSDPSSALGDCPPSTPRLARNQFSQAGSCPLHTTRSTMNVASQMTSTSQAIIDSDMWVDNPPPALPVASTSGAPFGRSPPPVSYHHTYNSHPCPPAQFKPTQSLERNLAADHKGKRKATWPSVIPPRPVMPMGRSIPILHSGQKRTQPLPTVVPSEPPISLSSSSSTSPTLFSNPDDSRSTRTRPPAIRIRRVGALNISVSSDSESSFSSRAAGRKRRNRNGDGTTSSSEEDESGPSRDLSGESSERDSKTRLRVDEDQYRTIVDGLAMQSK